MFYFKGLLLVCGEGLFFVYGKLQLLVKRVCGFFKRHRLFLMFLAFRHVHKKRVWSESGYSQPTIVNIVN